MNHWLGYACIAIVLWGIVGLFQKLGTNRISARSLVVWLTVGFLVLLPFFWSAGAWTKLDGKTLAAGLLGGVLNGLGSWALFLSLEKGGKASIVVPMTALYPLVTIVLATVLLKERPTRWEWIGIAVALAGGVMLSYEHAPQEEAQAGKDDPL